LGNSSVYIKGLKPPLKWAGGKRWLIPYLIPFWELHSHRRLVEPLCGGLAVVLALRPKKALLNDINVHLINFFQWVQKGLYMELPMDNVKELYYVYRDRFNRLIEEGEDNSKEAAELFYYLNRTGYNGLCRFNQKGKYNVPFGRYNRIDYIREYRPYRELFKQWQFSCVDFEKLETTEDDFVYADPPYDVQFTHYFRDGFCWGDQVRLVEWLARRKCPVILSNQATDRVIELYQNYGFEVKYLNAPRRISCKGDRAPAQEVIALKGL
jgi:DNA adenine methylase